LGKKERNIKIILFILCAILFTYHLGGALPIIESEKFYFQSVKEMFARHDWITPYYQGRFRFQKPILFYWLVSASYLVFGINNFGVRFPSALFGILTVIFTFNIGRKLFDRKTGLLSAALLATFAIFFMYARYASPDMVLTFFVTYAIYLFIKGSKNIEEKKRAFLPFFVVLGLAALNKGYVGFMLPLIIVCAFLVSSRKWKLLKALNIPAGILVVMAIALPWYVLMYKLHGERYLNHVFFRETIMRIFYAPDNQRGLAYLASYFKRFLYYVPVLLVWFAPYSLFLPGAIADAFKSKNTYSREKDSYKLLLSFFFGIFAFFTLISVKEYHYMLPAAPACALIIARYLINMQERGSQFRSAGFTIPYLLITAIYTVGVIAILYTMNHLYYDKVALYEYALVLAPLILLVPYSEKRPRAALAVMPIAMGLFLVFLGGRAIPLLNDDTMRIFAEQIREDLKEDDKVGVGSINISQQRLGLYLNRHIEEPNMKWIPPDVVARHQNKIREFAASGSDTYLVISKDDYIKMVPDDIKDTFVVMDRRQTWKTRLKRSFSKKILAQILRGEKDILKDVLRHEVYLLTNKKGM